MKWILGLAIAMLVVGIAAPASFASPLPSKKFASCAALLKSYPSGVAKDARSASRAERAGYEYPDISASVYRANSSRLDRNRNGVLCEQESGGAGDSGGNAQTRSLCEGFFVIDAWNVPGYCDSYLDSDRIRSWCQGVRVIYGDVPSYCRKFL